MMGEREAETAIYIVERVSVINEGERGAEAARNIIENTERSEEGVRYRRRML